MLLFLVATKSISTYYKAQASEQNNHSRKLAKNPYNVRKKIMENSQNLSNSNTNNSSTIGRNELIGKVIAEKYQITRLLGRGGMGAVYEGQHLLLEKPIAIKVMASELAEDKSALSRFMREAKTAAKLEHPNAVTIHDFGVWQENIAYIVMEYISGVSLRDWLSANKVASPLQTVKWLSQACSAIASAHEAGIIHRDLKPENIMLKDGADGEPIIKVVDFGLAKIIKDGEASSTHHITKTGEVLGTPYYMGPEYYDNDVVDHRADIYALGIIAYEMLSGRPPFHGSIEKIIAAHLFQEPRPLATQHPDLEAFDRIIGQALKKKRDERLSSASDFAKGLKSIMVENPNLSSIEEAATLRSLDFLSTGTQKKDPSTASQMLGSKTLYEAKTGEQVLENSNSISKNRTLEVEESKKTEPMDAAKTQAHQLGTVRMLPTTQMSANTGVIAQAAVFEQENITVPATQVVIKPTPKAATNKRIPIYIGLLVGVVLGLGTLGYIFSKSASSSANNVSNPVIKDASPKVNNSPTPTVKFAETPIPNANGDNPSDLTTGPTATEITDKNTAEPIKNRTKPEKVEIDNNSITNTEEVNTRDVINDKDFRKDQKRREKIAREEQRKEEKRAERRQEKDDALIKRPGKLFKRIFGNKKD